MAEKRGSLALKLTSYESLLFIMGGGCIDNIAYSQPFYFPGDSRGCLLIHGFTGSPSEMLPLGQYLNNLGYTVHGVRLKGHGTTLQDMAHTRWKDWLDSGYTRIQEIRACM